MEKNENVEEQKQKKETKYEIEYLTLDSDEPKTEYVWKVVDLLYYVQQWYQEAIKWNLIASRDVSKIPLNFKSIYIKVYNHNEDLIFKDECVLESRGLKMGWIKID